MGSLFQTAYADAATELHVMGALGYDATTFGNHEYDYRASGLASMLSAAVDSGDPVPAIVEALPSASPAMTTAHRKCGTLLSVTAFPITCCLSVA